MTEIESKKRHTGVNEDDAEFGEPVIGTAQQLPQCNSCGKVGSAGAKFCESCGGCLHVLPTCNQCGKVGNAGARFCENCGGNMMIP